MTFFGPDPLAELSPEKREVRQQQDASQRRVARSELTPEQQICTFDPELNK